MIQMKVLLKPNQYSTYMSYIDVTTTQWNSLITKPMVLSNKDEAPLLIWGHPVDSPEPDLVSRKPRCTGANIDHINALQIDIDGGYPIDDFVKEYSKYSFQLYTSYSHTYKPGGDRYRVIFPLTEPIYMKHVCPPTRSELSRVFPMVDSTCFDRGHWQIIPCIRSNTATYRYIQNKGERIAEFPVSKFSVMAEDYATYRALNDQIQRLDRVGHQKENQSYAKALEWAQNQINGIPEGRRNTEYFRILSWLHTKVECDLYDVLDLEVPDDMRDEFVEMASRIFNA